jgi:hypothetical protein
MLKFIIKEASVLLAFVVLGGLLLLCFWVSDGLNRGILAEYRDSKVSVVVPADRVEPFRQFVERDKNVIRYDYFNSQANKSRWSELYPEMKNVIAPLEPGFFPSSAIVTVKDASLFLQGLDRQVGITEKHIVHQPPHQLMQFLNGLTLAFGILWILTLVLVLYFNIERITAQQEARWSLMKMLGERPFKLFIPLWLGQSARISVAIIFAMALAWFSSDQIRSLFAWNWTSLGMSVWVTFVVSALFMTWGISYVLFRQRFQRISLG